MPTFYYKVSVSKKKTITGQIVAADRAAAEERIRAMDYKILELSESPDSQSFTSLRKLKRLAWAGLFLIALSMIILAGWFVLKPDPSSPQWALREFYRLVCVERKNEGALDRLFDFRAEDLKKLAPRLQQVMVAFRGGEASLGKVQIGSRSEDGVTVELKVVEYYSGFGPPQRSELSVWMSRELGPWRIDAHRSATLNQKVDLSKLQDAGSHFATPLQAALNTCHLAVNDEDWWQVAPRLRKLRRI